MRKQISELKKNKLQFHLYSLVTSPARYSKGREKFSCASSTSLLIDPRKFHKTLFYVHRRLQM